MSYDSEFFDDYSFDCEDSVKDPSILLTRIDEQNSSSVISDGNIVLNEVNKLLFSEFFKIVSERKSTTYERKMSGIIAKCLICNRNFKGSLRVNSNFVSHLRQQHPSAFAKFKENKPESRQYKLEPNNFNLDFGLNGVNKLLFSEFFKIVSERKSMPFGRKVSGIIAKCLICNNNFKGSLTVNTNFVSHLRNQHPSAFAKFKENKPESRENKLDPNNFNLDFVLNGVNKLLFTEFFKIVSERKSTPYERKMSGIIAKCLICNNNFKGSLIVNTNFLSHLRNRHPSAFAKFKGIKPESRQNKLHPNNFNLDLLNFLGASCSPFYILESEEFKQLFPNKSLPSRRALTTLLSENHNIHIDDIGNKLRNQQYVCTTADIWSGGNRFFLGVTCHWLNAHSLSRHSAALACRRFKGANSYDNIAEILLSIYGQYNLPVGKIVYTITDNGSNFLKEFREFGAPLKKYAAEEESDDGTSSNEEKEEESHPEFFSVNQCLSKLFTHVTCTSHALNLLALHDLLQILKSPYNTDLFNLHTATFQRCTQIWNNCHRRKSAEIIQQTLGYALIAPCVTKWNSLFDSAKKLASSKTKLNELCEKLEVEKFEEVEIEYLEEYIKLMTPISEALDFLQLENNMYYGYIIPTLVSLRVKLRRLEEAQFKMLGNVCNEMQTALINRFANYFYVANGTAWDAVVAAIVLPDVKMKFCKALCQTATGISIESVTSKLKAYAVEFCDVETVISSAGTPQSSFLDFGDEINEPQNVDVQIALYLRDVNSDLGSLDQYPILKKMFLKLNTPLPSSAPVERLFSFAEIIKRSQRQCLSDQNFEQLVLRKANDFQ